MSEHIFITRKKKIENFDDGSESHDENDIQKAKI